VGCGADHDVSGFFVLWRLPGEVFQLFVKNIHLGYGILMGGASQHQIKAKPYEKINYAFTPAIVR
jgi:hypothetical protein